jgi:hypothetical protein
MNRASTSLPVPDSPTMSTVQSLVATRRARSASRRELGAQATSSTSGACGAVSVFSSDIRPSHARMHSRSQVAKAMPAVRERKLRERSQGACDVRQETAAGNVLPPRPRLRPHYVGVNLLSRGRRSADRACAAFRRASSDADRAGARHEPRRRSRVRAPASRACVRSR